MENPIKMDDLGVPLFLETSICQHTKPNNMNTTFELQVPIGRNQSSWFLNWKSLTLFTFGSFLWN